ncbi:MAG: class I SAM-dependent methyltransferase [Candidatus Sungbacteria bacterium]|nr:class I SAM-dependent methyltransferase [Candidatus Sungbacteria bacterium]
MMISELSKETLTHHYRALGDIRHDFRNANLARLIAFLVKGRDVLDMGCGSGFLMDILRRRGKNVLGIEPLPEMIALARRHFPGLTILKGHAEELEKLVEQPVDTIIMADVLEHIENDTEQLKKVYTRLRNGGELILVVPAHQFLYGERDRRMGHYRRYSRGALRRLLAENGFLVSSLRYWDMLGFLPYLLSEKVLQRPLEAGLRSSDQKGLAKKILQRVLQLWFRGVENNFDFGFGLSLICIAKKACM